MMEHQEKFEQIRGKGIAMIHQKEFQSQRYDNSPGRKRKLVTSQNEIMDDLTQEIHRIASRKMNNSKNRGKKDGRNNSQSMMISRPFSNLDSSKQGDQMVISEISIPGSQISPSIGIENHESSTKLANLRSKPSKKHSSS